MNTQGLFDTKYHKDFLEVYFRGGFIIGGNSAFHNVMFLLSGLTIKTACYTKITDHVEYQKNDCV